MSKVDHSEAARIADQLRRAFYGGAWHGDSLFETLEGVTAERAAARPVANAHTIWELVLHIAAWDGVVRRRMTGVAVAELPDKKNFPPVLDASAAAWASTLEEVRRVHEELIAAVEKFPEKSLTKPVPGKKGAHYNFYYMLHGVLQHELYHAGQIALLKKM
ncbi:MAG: DinB family protein [Terriglobales bacterium]